MEKNTPGSPQGEGFQNITNGIEVDRLVPALTDTQRQNIIDYYELNKLRAPEYQQEALVEFSNHPVWGPIISQMSPEMMEMQRKSSEKIQEAAIYNNEWKPYLIHLMEQGAVYARMGVNFKDWLEIVLLSRKHFTAILQKEFGNDVDKVLSCMQGMNYLLDIALAAIGESYVIEEKKKAKQELEQINESLEKVVEERTKKLSESLEREKQLSELKSNFVSMASHEFRTPLTTILSSVSLAEKYVAFGEADKGEKHFNRIRHMVQNLTEILQNFLSIDQLEQGQIDTQQVYFDLRLFLTELLEGLEAMKKEGQQIHWSFKGEELILMDKKILRNVLLNLLSNAIKYSEKDIEMNVEVSKKEVKIEIRDYGIGIPKEQQEHLFGKFFRAENALTVKGTGLGLHIVKHYLRLLNGRIDFESKEGHGTTFFLSLPSTKNIASAAC